MAWPASTTYLVDAFTNANRHARKIKEITENVKASSLAGPIKRSALLAYYYNLTVTISVWNDAKAVDGIVQYVQDQFNNPAIDVIAEFTAMILAAESLRTWIVANFPTDVSGAVLYNTLDPITGQLNDMTFTSAQLGAFRIEADALLTSIE